MEGRLGAWRRPEVRLSEAADGTVIHLLGEIDIETAYELRRAAESVRDAARVYVDFAEVEFIGAAGLAALLSIRNRLLGEGSVLVLRGLSVRTRRVFRLAEIDTLFEIQDR